MSIKITSLALENVKRVKAFALEPAENGLTVIGGGNTAGKTSVLDAIAWTLGGGRRAPSKPKRDGSTNPPTLSVTLSNGLTAERKGKNSTLTVTDPTGKRHGQALLDSFVSTFALDLPKFMSASEAEKAQILLGILGIGDQLTALSQQEQELYNSRHAIGQEKVKKVKHAEELPEYPDAPTEPVSVSELIQQQQAILARNGSNQQLRRKRDSLQQQADTLAGRVADLKQKLADATTAWQETMTELATAEKSAEQLTDESTAEIEASLANIETINAHVAANAQKARATDEAAAYTDEYDNLTAALEQARADRLALLEGAPLPLPELTIEDGGLRYRDQPWDGMSGAEQLQVAAAIVRKLKPECGFVLMDKLEAFDLATLADFAGWLEAEGLQAIATRVSTGEECTIIIEDGLPQGQTYIETVAPIEAATEGDDENGTTDYEW